MKIGIEAQRIFRKKKHGMDMVALELIRNLQEVDKVNQYVVFVAPDEDDKVVQETPNFKIVKLAGGFYPLWEQIALPRAVKREGCDILHCTSNTAPIFSPVPVVDILHDIIYMEKSYLQILKGTGTPYQKFGNIYRKLVVPRVVKKSVRITTVSHFEKNRIGEFFGMKGDNRLRAVYNGFGSHFKPLTEKAELQRIKEKYQLPDRYFFFLGNTDPKKNTRGVLKAFSDFMKQTTVDYKLVMLDYDRNELEKLVNDIGDPDLEKRVVLTGYVVNTDLPGIYAQCELFLYPSLRESFGIPMLEAMGCGAPVITSNTSSMPEVACDAAFIIDPYKPEEITSAMVQLLADENLRNDLITKGFVQAAKFSWKAMAEQFLEIYRDLEPELKPKK
ncbi:MAG TPA: group 1 glycosyl transferase [Prolixibacteraceae bacterium]|nr:group 1 glycosyl transferase [Prolixibacteraceae bacterium]